VTTIEMHQIVIARRPASTGRAWCPACLNEVELASLEEAAFLTGVSLRDICRPAGTVPISGNLVLKNQVHENQRSGICIMGAAQDNVVLKNDATGNNLSRLAPCLTFNLFDESPVDNSWKKNQGKSNF
jgi:parallel beta-helix repeat protein